MRGRHHNADLLRTNRSTLVRGEITDDNTSMTKKNIVYITTPIYYVNDSPHIGHAYTTIAADVLTRFHKLHGREVFFLTGTDEHGAKVAESAEKAGKKPKAFVDEVSGLFRASFQELNIQFDKFIRTTDEEHERQVLVFMEKLKANGSLYEDEYEGLYCTGCEEFKTEKELVGGNCPVHLNPVEHIKEKNWFFRLTQYLPKVRKLIESGKLEIVPHTRKEEVLGLFKQDLADFSVSRSTVKWGIPFPGDEKQTIYVWVEALQNYITAIGYVDDRSTFKKYWPHATHFIGKDILKFHAVYWPAMLLAAGEVPPRRIIVNGYFQLNGQKMSKSLGNVIAPHDLVQQYGVDATRYLLMSQFPFGEDGNIQADRFTEQYNADLANGLGNLASRVLAMVTKFSGGEMPVYDKKSLALTPRSETAHKQYEQQIENGEFYESLKTIWSVIADANVFVQQQQPWELAKKDEKTVHQVLADLVLTLVRITHMVAPFVPDTAGKLRAALLLENFGLESFIIPAGRAFLPLAALFPRMERGEY